MFRLLESMAHPARPNLKLGHSCGQKPPTPPSALLLLLLATLSHHNNLCTLCVFLCFARSPTFIARCCKVPLCYAQYCVVVVVVMCAGWQVGRCFALFEHCVTLFSTLSIALCFALQCVLVMVHWLAGGLGVLPKYKHRSIVRAARTHPSQPARWPQGRISGKILRARKKSIKFKRKRIELRKFAQLENFFWTKEPLSRKYLQTKNINIFQPMTRNHCQLENILQLKISQKYVDLRCC